MEFINLGSATRINNMNNISSQGNLFLDDFSNFIDLIDNLYYKCNFKLKLVVKKMNGSPLKNSKIDRGLEF